MEIEELVWAAGMVSAIPLTALVFKLGAKVFGVAAVDKSIKW